MSTIPDLPLGRLVELPDRKPIWVRDAPGPDNAPTLFLLHGLGASSALNWFSAFPILRQHFRVIAPDHRGHGRTPRESAAFTLERCADDAFAVADALGVDRLVAVGYSMGGPIAQLMWRQQPHRIEGLVLAATSRDFRGRARDRIGFQTIPVLLAAARMPNSRAVRNLVLALLAPRIRPDLRAWASAELRGCDPRSVLEAAAALGEFTSRSWLHEVDVPSSVIVAMHDQVVPVRRQLKLARAIDGCVAAFVDGDHYAVASAPDDFLPVLLHECLAVTRPRGDRASAAPSYWQIDAGSLRPTRRSRPGQLAAKCLLLPADRIKIRK